MVPETPTVTRILFPEVISLRFSDVPEVLAVQEVPFDEVRIVPELPTETYDLVVLELSEVVVSSSAVESTINDVIVRVLLILPEESVTVIVQFE
tara:strand:+ start:1822 stop:2103 length:282 start_codon:yes stop_codon:yes gene_type:complete